MSVTSGSASTSFDLAFATKKTILAALNGGAVINASLPGWDSATVWSVNHGLSGNLLETSRN